MYYLDYAKQVGDRYVLNFSRIPQKILKTSPRINRI